MPCTQTGSLEGDRALDADMARSEATRLTQMLCDLCKTFDETFVEEEWELLLNNMKAGKRLAAWWKSHKKIDADNS